MEKQDEGLSNNNMYDTDDDYDRLGKFRRTPQQRDDQRIRDRGQHNRVVHQPDCTVTHGRVRHM
jgi:hypothetical protein